VKRDYVKPPLCECHGLVMARNGVNRQGEIRWECKVKRAKRALRYYESNREKVLAQQAEYKARRQHA